MFHESTQKGLWFFDSPQQLADVRCAKFKSIPAISFEDEVKVVLFYDRLLREFCDTCEPTIPRATMATACAYLKRLYLRNSIIDYPIEKYYRTCIYLACKVDEFNLTSDDFVRNFKQQGASEGVANEMVTEILKTELKLISLLQFSLIVHSPCRPQSGFLIAVKNYFINENKPEHVDEKVILTEIDGLATKADSFVLWSLATDVCFLYSPSQIALASLLYASKSAKVVNIVQFMENLTNRVEKPEVFDKLYAKVCEVVNTVKSLKIPTKEFADSVLLKAKEYRERDMRL
ncbi:cyclin-H-like [Convolutriloba macropyga]|uniref:cyclin-H-like n=1 Tax=Convolutriloba macropyga TaxID=536237 RepID=UPI003F51AD86